MSAAGASSEDVAAGAFSLKPGRRLCWGGDWPCSEAAVLFDGNSGDYWVLSPTAGAAIRLLGESGPLTVEDIEAALSGLDSNDAEPIRSLIGNLQRFGLLARAQG